MREKVAKLRVLLGLIFGSKKNRSKYSIVENVGWLKTLQAIKILLRNW